MGVNLLVFPISSERELREAMVGSLDHIGTFCHLLAKTYTMTLTDDERAAREALARTIRVSIHDLLQPPLKFLLTDDVARFWDLERQSRCRCHRS